MRLFIAVPLPKKEKDRIHRAIREFRESELPVRWLPPENYHLTLKFLGAVKKERVPVIQGVLSDIARSTAPFPVDLSGFGAFPTIRNPRVFWVGVEASPALRCLKQDLEWGLADHGFEPETRAFHPHLTVGRVPEDGRAGAFRGMDELAASMDYSGHVEVKRLEVMRSHLSREGARYDTFHTCTLAAS